MRLTNKLEHWQQAGLLTDDQVRAILDHEKQANRFRWQNGLYFLAVFAIVVGILSIIAAYWQQIPGAVKIVAHLLVNTGLALAVLHAERRNRQGVKEWCLLAWFGLTLTFIGLIGQVFHLSANVPGALLLWLALSSPAIVAVSNNALTLMLWLICLLLTLLLNLGEHVAPLNSLFAISLFAVLIPVAMAAISRLLASTGKTVLHRQMAMLAPVVTIVGASIACQFWYVSGVRDEPDIAFNQYLSVTVVLLSLLGSFYPRVTVPFWLGSVGNLRLLLLAALTVITVPYVLNTLESALLAALSFIGFWLLLGYIGHRSGAPRLISLAILVVTIRIYIVYLEVFGSMLQTGFGLIGSGLLLLVMLKLAQQLNRKVHGGTRSDGAVS